MPECRSRAGPRKVISKAMMRQRVSQRRMIWIGHSGVGDNDGVAGEFAAMRFEKFREVCAADFLFPSRRV